MLKHLVDPLHPTLEWPSDIKLKCEIGQSTIIELSHSGGYLAAGFAEGALAVFDVDTWSVLFRFRAHSMPILAMKWSKDAKHLVTVGSDWLICIWDMSKKQLLRNKQLDFCPTAASFEIESPFIVALVCGTSLSVCNLSINDSSDQLEEFEAPPDSDVAVFSCVQMLSPSIIACGTSKGNLHIYENSKILHSSKLSTGSLRALTFAPSRAVLAVACSDKAVRVFYLRDAIDEETLKLNADCIEIGHKFTDLGLQSQWNSLAFSQDGEYLYAASDIRQGTISIWNVLTRFAVRQLRGNAERLTSIKFDQERVMLVGSGRDSGAIFVWRADPPKAWASLISEFEHIPDIEVYQEKESDWDLPDRELKVSEDTDVDVWTLPEPRLEFTIPVEL